MSVLDRFTVIDLSRGRCGAYAVMQLAEFGAKVLRMDPAPSSAADEALHWGSRPIPENAELSQLLDGADVLVTEQDQLPSGWDKATLRTRFPKLICAVIQECAENGGALAEAASGMMDMTGFPDTAPTLSGGGAAECFAGVSLSYAITAAIRRRERDGEGAWIDYSLYDTFFSLLESPILFEELLGVSSVRCGSADPGTLVPYDVFRCQDGYFSVGLASDAGWDRFCEAIGMPELYDDPRYNTNEKRCQRYEEMSGIFAPFFAKRSRADLQEIFTVFNIPCAPVLTAWEAAQHPQIQAREMIRHVSGCGGPMPLTCTPMRMSVTKPVYQEKNSGQCG